MRKHPSERESRHKSRDPFHDFPLADADLCVKCALCLPHCPTYKLSHHEGDSPRGRIALMQGLAQGALEPAGKTLPHLDGCLVCRACEPVCPAEVPYGRLIDAGRRGLWRSGHRPGWMWKSLAFLRRTPRRLAWLTRLVRLAHRSGAAKLAAHLPLGHVARAAKFIQETGAPPSFGTHSQSATNEKVALFLGCLARPLDADVLHATVRVLNVMRFAVDIPTGQGCCGAMDAHAGDRETAVSLSRQNVAAFGEDATPIISTASGCGVQLQETENAAFSERVTDVMQFIAANADRLPTLSERNEHVIVHSPCSLKNGMREAGALDVLRRISGLTVEALRHQDCCGAAGSYLFEHAMSADKLGEKLLDALGDNIPDIFVTSNIGCALHVRRLAALRGLNMKVLHPVQLLDACLTDSSL
ncbi:MAG TPA: (Fe-S)-binding protein [Gammaproteobacteria bacterium]